MYFLLEIGTLSQLHRPCLKVLIVWGVLAMTTATAEMIPYKKVNL